MWGQLHRGFESHPLCIRRNELFALFRLIVWVMDLKPNAKHYGFERGASRVRRFFFKGNEISEKKTVGTFNASDSRQSHPLCIRRNELFCSIPPYCMGNGFEAQLYFNVTFESEGVNVF